MLVIGNNNMEDIDANIRRKKTRQIICQKYFIIKPISL